MRATFDGAVCFHSIVEARTMYELLHVHVRVGLSRRPNSGNMTRIQKELSVIQYVPGTARTLLVEEASSATKNRPRGPAQPPKIGLAVAK